MESRINAGYRATDFADVLILLVEMTLWLVWLLGRNTALNKRVFK